MFDHIWDCEIDHPVYQDTVGELMEAVIQTYEKHKPTLGTNLASLGTDCISRQAAIDAVMECYDNDELFEVYERKLNELPPIQPDIIYCGECTKMKVDSVFHDCWCSETGKKVWINHFCGYAERKEVTT